MFAYPVSTRDQVLVQELVDLLCQADFTTGESIEALEQAQHFVSGKVPIEASTRAGAAALKLADRCRNHALAVLTKVEGCPTGATRNRILSYILAARRQIEDARCNIPVSVLLSAHAQIH